MGVGPRASLAHEAAMNDRFNNQSIVMHSYKLLAYGANELLSYMAHGDERREESRSASKLGFRPKIRALFLAMSHEPAFEP